MNPPQVYMCFPILNPPPSSLPIPSLWVVTMHQPQASSIVHRTWTGNSFQATHSSILAWKIPWTVHGVTKSQTQLSDFHFHLRDVLCVRFKLIPSSDRDGFQQQYWAVSSGRTVQMCLSDAGVLGAQQEKS